jgi:DNA (cytosine-5)-methyltransferase 1
MPARLAPTFGSLFSGIGGMDLGLERAGWRCAWQVEIDSYARRVLAKHWPAVPRFRDVREVGTAELARVDLIAGGFPCQDISAAHTNGERLGIAGPRSGLWHEFARIVGELRPRAVIAENVDQWHRWLPDVRADLAGLGYASVPLELPAGALGALHPRPRVFVVAYANGESEPLRALHEEVAGLRPVARGDGHWRTPAPGVLRVADGLPGEMDRLRTLGNAVVPQVAEWLGQRLLAVQPALQQGDHGVGPCGGRP